MACYHAIPAIQDRPGAEIRLWPPLGNANLALPCGKCLGCRTDHATHWANRCTHEASQHEHNTFLTLTYDDDHIPKDGHLRPDHLQRFIKRLRKHATSLRNSLARDRNVNTRYFACGEYGSTTMRPHYHALIFNGAFTDTHRVGKDLWESDELQRLWPDGQHRIGECTPASAAYIAQYSLKKLGSGDFNPDTGEWRRAPFLRMSLKPAIGADWLKKYKDDLTQGYVVENGRKHPIPRYYRNKIKTEYPELHEYVEQQLENHRRQITDKKNPDRIRDTEEIHTRRKQLTEDRKL